VNRAPRVAWNRPLGDRRSIALTSLRLGDVKAAASAGGATVNDVVLTVLGGACRAYLAGRDELPDRPLVVAVPVSVRGDDTITDTNAVSIMFTSVGTDIDEPSARLAAVHAAAARAKHQHDALGGDVLGSWLEVAAPVVFSTAARLYTVLDLAAFTPPLANLLVSNVPGSPVPLYFGGARLRGLYPLGPVYDGVGLNVTVVSSEDTLGFGLVTCPDVLADLEGLAAQIRVAFADLVAAQATARNAPSVSSAMPASTSDLAM
jgi:WS/DGAT/MGAT family acyltransferase